MDLDDEVARSDAITLLVENPALCQLSGDMAGFSWSRRSMPTGIWQHSPA